ncbi:MAG: MgtC/SapB family protein [Oxalobacter sp.]|jgi:putative Mg2+ transporter-C (MgtC) family protein|nr:MgtC/SapB family protein [Oxalobacter sp.]MBR6000110.1 MgtC/SapB family protein [Oxalobacter sp.]
MFNNVMVHEIPYLFVAIKLICAVCAGGIIGLERAFHGRPTGFRTHSIVCLAGAALVQVIVYLPVWMGGAPTDVVRTDATRVMQGVMTGIGFLGAGVIFREGLTIRGLTTAASIWITATIGLLFGIGFFYVGVLTTVIAIIVLTVFRRIEGLIHTQTYAHCMVSFARDSAVSVEDFLAVLAQHELVVVGNVNHQVTPDGKDCELNMTIRSRKLDAFANVSGALRHMPEYKTFNIEYIRD